ncbi:MAG: aldo/keto reductase [Clostridia bacterium]|nr:aldo/keto reductase [Clostridia bacterium]
MKVFELPGTDIPVSAFVLGTDYYGKTISPEDAFELLDSYFSLGGRTVDTAHVYADYLPGEKHSSEKTIGRWLRESKKRQYLTICTKGGFPELSDCSASRLGRDEVRRDLTESLSCLGIDCVDIYWLHRDDPRRSCGEFIQYLEDFKKEGLIRAYGFSNFGVRRMREADAWAEGAGLDPVPAVQIKWGLAKTAPGRVYDSTLAEMDDEYFDYLKNSGKALFAYSAQAKGFFSKLRFAENGSPVMEPGKCRDRYYCEENIKLYRELFEEAGRLGSSAARLALRKMLESPFPTALILGCRNRDQLFDSIRGFDEGFDRAFGKDFSGIQT